MLAKGPVVTLLRGGDWQAFVVHVGNGGEAGHRTAADHRAVGHHGEEVEGPPESTTQFLTNERAKSKAVVDAWLAFTG